MRISLMSAMPPREVHGWCEYELGGEKHHRDGRLPVLEELSGSRRGEDREGRGRAS